MKVEGRCHCGAIVYEAEVDPDSLGLCHCTDCQTLSGSPFRATITALPGSFRLLQGSPRIYVKTAESGNKRAQAFCEECGTPIYASAAVENPPSYSLRIGAIKERAALRPQRQIWCQSALPWGSDLGAVRTFPRGS